MVLTAFTFINGKWSSCLVRGYLSLQGALDGCGGFDVILCNFVTLMLAAYWVRTHYQQRTTTLTDLQALGIFLRKSTRQILVVSGGDAAEAAKALSSILAMASCTKLSSLVTPRA